MSKSDTIIDLLGELDELQSFVGWCRCAISDSEICKVLDRVQDDIYRMMSIVGFEMKCPGNIVMISDDDVEFLEGKMEKFKDGLGDLGKFIRPGTSEEAARFHIVRCVCRRVERKMAGLSRGEDEDGAGTMAGDVRILLKYLNRLSDLMFVLGYGFE